MTTEEGKIWGNRGGGTNLRKKNSEGKLDDGAPNESGTDPKCETPKPFINC